MHAALEQCNCRQPARLRTACAHGRGTETFAVPMSTGEWTVQSQTLDATAQPLLCQAQLMQSQHMHRGINHGMHAGIDPVYPDTQIQQHNLCQPAQPLPLLVAGSASFDGVLRPGKDEPLLFPQTPCHGAVCCAVLWYVVSYR